MAAVQKIIILLSILNHKTFSNLFSKCFPDVISQINKLTNKKECNSKIIIIISFLINIFTTL